MTEYKNPGCKQCRWHYLRTPWSPVPSDFHHHVCYHESHISEKFNFMNGVEKTPAPCEGLNSRGECELYEEQIIHRVEYKPDPWWKRLFGCGG